MACQTIKVFFNRALAIKIICNTMKKSVKKTKYLHSLQNSVQCPPVEFDVLDESTGKAEGKFPSLGPGSFYILAGASIRL